MKATIGIAAAVIVACLCGLPLIAVLGDTRAAIACTTATSGGQVVLREQPGPVGDWSSTQTANAAIIVGVGQRRQIPPRGWVIAVATAMTESSLVNTSTVTDHDSVGLFQQRPSQGWGTPAQLIDPVYTSTRFYDALLKVAQWQSLPLTEAAQAVQRSAFPDAYADNESDAEKVVAAVTGKSSITGLTGASLAQCTAPGAVSASGWVKPVAAEVGSGYGPRGGRLHAGVDLLAERNTVIHAAAAGRVVVSQCQHETGNCNVDGSPSTAGCGWYVDIVQAGGVGTRYCHMIRRPEVAVGDVVTAGQPIGLVGTSGHSYGPHLHFEVHLGVCDRDGSGCDLSAANSTDPVSYMREVAGAELGP